MKKILVLLVAGCIMAACNNKKEDSKTEIKTEEKSTTPDTNTQVPPPVSNENTSTTSSGWSTTDENSFMRDCKSTAVPKVGEERANDYCDCMLQKVIKAFSSYYEANLKLTEADATRMANECNSLQ